MDEHLKLLAALIRDEKKITMPEQEKILAQNEIIYQDLLFKTMSIHKSIDKGKIPSIIAGAYYRYTEKLEKDLEEARHAAGIAGATPRASLAKVHFFLLAYQHNHPLTIEISGKSRPHRRAGNRPTDDRRAQDPS